MADQHAAAPPIDSDWSIFDRLAQNDEKGLRRILRSHRDVPFRGDAEHDAEALTLRFALDEALDRLMLLELAAEAGVPNSTLPSSKGLLTLFQSSAFARYVNAYLYFGVRFVAVRLLGNDSYKQPLTKGKRTGGKDPKSSEKTESNTFEINEPPFALPCPPDLPPDPATMGRIAQRRGSETKDHDVQKALEFLDDVIELGGEQAGQSQEATPAGEGECGWQADYERWLRGLGHNPERAAYFRTITAGLRKFVRVKVDFYTGLEGKARIDSWRLCGHLRDGCAKNPFTARFGFLDLYWLARLLRSEVSSVGIVSYSGASWLSLLAQRPLQAGEDPVNMEEAEPVLRAVFDFTCDLIQNAVAIASDAFDRSQRPETYSQWPANTVVWRRAYDEELAEVAIQRTERGFGSSAAFAGNGDGGGEGGDDSTRVGWSRRVRTGEHLENLVGLAFSGGGIRSATFNLGVLQRLQELDLLRGVDYLSTVSGGGYVGSWLLGNVRRTTYWLSQLTDWGPSIAHLRRYSNYLAPRTGLMSVDTWTMWASWVRNAFLIQLTALAWLSVLLVVTRINEAVFTWRGFKPLAAWPGNLILAPLVILLTVSICINLRRQTHSIKEWHVLTFAVAPAWVGSFLTAAMLWAGKPDTAETYSAVLAGAWSPWFAPLLIMFGSLWILSACSINRKRWQAWLFGMVTAAAAMAVVYLGFCGVRWLFGQWSDTDPQFEWFAYVVGPPLVLFAISLPVVVIIGLIGTASQDWRREWWTRFGSWLGILGVGFLILSLVSVFGPLVTLSVFEQPWGTVQWSTVLGWIGTIIGGLLSGGSDKTTGNSGRTLKAAALEWFTKVAALVFIVGAVLIASTGLHVLLVQIFTGLDVSSQVYWFHLHGTDGIQTSDYWLSLLVLLVLGLVFSWRFEINIFGLNHFYRNRLIRCYLGATRWLPGLRKPHRFTGFDEADDLPLSALSNHSPAEQSYRGPFPIVNGSLNLGGSSDLTLHTRHSASFVFTPLRAGAERKAVGYAPMLGAKKMFSGGVTLGQAISVSGAAASPNMGYSTSPLVAFLLTMFNVRLAWWFPNPGRAWWHRSTLPLSTWYLAQEMFGAARENKRFVNVSDGGHFENLGIYELVRRRCKVIIASDAECDPGLTFGSLGNVIRLCETDFGAKIEIDVESMRKQKDSALSRAHCAVGRIHYSNGSRGYLIYLKSSLSGDEDVSIRQYRDLHEDFPHETTGDQFFAEDQFESYRLLGRHITKLTFRDVEHDASLVEMADKLTNIWVPAAIGGDSFVGQARALDEMWERFRTTASLHPLLDELMTNQPSPYPARLTPEQLVVCMELFQLMENVFIALQLDDFWDHPDNRGWVVLFTMWAKSGTFRAAWKQTQETFGIGFVYFCEQRLGLERVG